MNIQFNVAEIELLDKIRSRMFTSVKFYLLYFLMFTVTTNNLLKHPRRIYNLDIPGGSGPPFSRPALLPDTSSSTPSTISSSKQGADILPLSILSSVVLSAGCTDCSRPASTSATWQCSVSAWASSVALSATWGQGQCQTENSL